jgi:hypothetical protein
MRKDRLAIDERTVPSLTLSVVGRSHPSKPGLGPPTTAL